MKAEDRQAFWEAIENGNNPLLSAMHSLTEKWGMPAIIMALGDIAKILSEDAETASLTPNERGLIMGACACQSVSQSTVHGSTGRQKKKYESKVAWPHCGYTTHGIGGQGGVPGG